MSITERMRKNIAKAREAKGLTQAQLAELMGVDRSYVNRWEREGPGPGLETLAVIARKLDTSVTALIGERAAKAS